MTLRKKGLFTMTAMLTLLFSFTVCGTVFARADSGYLDKYLKYNLEILDIGFEEINFKPAKDFAGTNYLIGENKTGEGYFIYNSDEKIITEYSLSGESPYKNYETNLIYGGMTEYFVVENSYYKSIVDNEQKYDVNEVKPYTAYNKMSYDNSLTPLASYVPAEISVAHPDFFNTILRENCGYSVTVDSSGETHGRCGFVALGMLIAYADKYKNDNLMQNKFYVDSINRIGLHNDYYTTVNNKSISNYIYNLHPKDGTTSMHIKETMNIYVEERNKQLNSNSQMKIKWSSLWRPFISNHSIWSPIKNNCPIILFGNHEYEDNNQVTIKEKNHAVVAYGAKLTVNGNYYWRCHFGWESGPYDVFVTGGIIGSIYHFDFA